MSVKMTESPKSIQPYLFHGVQLEWSDTSDQAHGPCPFCQREKFFVSTETGQWDCKVCGAKGNATTFLRQLWAECDRRTNGQTVELAAQRRLVNNSVLVEWGVTRSVVTGDWLVPGYSADGKLTQLYRYVRDQKTKKTVLLATTGMPHGLHGVNLFDPRKPDVYVCEGPWDAMALWEVMRSAKVTGDGLAFTGSVEASLLARSNVLAVPGCNVFSDSWAPLLAGRRVFLLFDSDHPVGSNGSTREPVGHAAMKRLAGLLSRGGSVPGEVQYLRWGDAGYDPQRKSGYDVRDLLGDAGATTQARIPALAELLGRLKPVPREWVPGGSAKAGSVEVATLPCRDWKTLRTACVKAMNWPPPGEGLDHGMVCILACIVSTPYMDDSVWLKVMGPPSSGKTTIAEATGTARKYVFQKDTMTGLVSGYQVDRAGSENMSLAPQLNNKTLVIKDGDTVLSDPSLPKILSQFRAFYDKSLRSQYGNKMSADHESINATVIICGTSSLARLDASELGDRFLTCNVMDSIDDEVEDAVLDRIGYRMVDNLKSGSSTGASAVNESSLRMMRLAGGYVEHLRENSDDLLAALEVPPAVLERCKRMAKFIAFMRARPSAKQLERAEREFAGRIMSQLVRLTLCVAVVLNKDRVDDKVVARVRKVCVDTARGRVLEIARHLYAAGDRGMEVGQLYLLTGQKIEDEKALLQFLGKIGAVEVFTPRSRGVQSRPRWRLTQSLRRLYADVMVKQK